MYLLGGDGRSPNLERDAGNSQVFGGTFQMLLGSAVLYSLITAENVSPITFLIA